MFEGNLEFAPIDAPAALRLGDGLTVAFPIPEHGLWMEASIWVEGREDDLIYRSLEDDQDGITLDLTAAELEEQEVAAGDFLNIRAYANGYGYDDVEYYRMIPVIDPASEAAVINFDGNDNTDVAVLVNEDIYITVSSPDEREIRAVRFYDGNNFWSEEEPGEDGMFHTGHSFGWPGAYSLFAMVTYDEWNEEWDGTDIDEREWVYTNVLGVNVSNDGNVGPFEISLDRDTIVRGEALEVTFTESEFATNYWIDVWDDVDEDNDGWRRYDWDWAWKDDWHEVNGVMVRTAVVSTAAMPAGTYYVSGKANEVGYMEYSTPDQSFEILDMENMPEVLFVVDRTEAVTGEDITYSAFAEGANRIIVYHDYDQDEWNRQERDRDRFAKPVSYSHAGEYTLIACAVYGEDEEEEYRYSNPVTVNIAAPNGELAFGEIKVPASLCSGRDDLTVTFPKPKNAEYMDASIWVDNWEAGDIAYSEIWDDQDNITLSVDAGELQAIGVMPGDVLHIHANARAYGWGQADFDHRISVIAEPSGEVELTFDEDIEVDTNGAGNVLVNQEVHVTLRGTGDRQIQGIRFFGGYDFWNDEGPDENNEYHRGPSFGETGVRSLYALVTFDEWKDEYGELDYDPREWVYTNALTVNVSKNGDTDPFTISLDQTEVARGDKIRVTFTKSANATDYWLNGDFGENWWYWVDEEAGIAEVTTVNICEGVHWISAGAGAFGLQNTESNRVHFSVVPREDNAALFRIDPEQDLLLNQNLRVELYAPGAWRLGLAVDGNPWHLDENGNYCWGDGDSMTSFSDVRWDNEGDAGEHTLTAYALYDEEGEWEVVEEKTINVVCEGRLDFDISTLPSYLTAGQDAEFTLRLPENAQTMHVQLYRDYRVEPESEEDDGWRRDVLNMWHERPDDLVISINGNDLVDGELIQIDYQADGFGWQRAEQGRRIPVIAGQDSGVVLTLEGEVPEGVVDIQKDEERRFLVSATGNNTLTAVRFFDGYGWWEDGDEINHENHEDWFEDGSFFAWKGYGDTDPRSVYAKVRLNGGDEWYTTNVITLNVYSLGQTGPFDFDSLEEVSVIRGDMVQFSFTPSENAENYWADAFDMDGNSYIPETSYDERTVTMSTVNLPAGEYEVWGRAGKYGWDWTESDNCVKLTVTEPEEGAVILSPERTSVITQQEINWSVYAPGAVKISVDSYMLEGEERNYFFGDYNNEGWDDTTFISGRNIFGGHAGAAYLVARALYADGSEKEEQVEITVTAPYGDLSPATIRSGLWYEGDNLNFSVIPDVNMQWYVINDVWDATEGHGDTYYRTPEGRGEFEDKVINLPHSLIGSAHIGVDIYQAAEGYNDIGTRIYLRPINTAGVLQLPADLTAIEEEAFMGNSSITHVVIPDGTASIGDRAFSNCGGLYTIEIPNSVTSFGNDVFDAGNITIYGYRDSAAQLYAIENGIEFAAIN